jgi:hypothetical protein
VPSAAPAAPAPPVVVAGTVWPPVGPPKGAPAASHTTTPNVSPPMSRQGSSDTSRIVLKAPQAPQPAPVRPAGGAAPAGNLLTTPTGQSPPAAAHRDPFAIFATTDQRHREAGNVPLVRRQSHSSLRTTTPGTVASTAPAGTVDGLRAAGSTSEQSSPLLSTTQPPQQEQPAITVTATPQKQVLVEAAHSPDPSGNDDVLNAIFHATRGMPSVSPLQGGDRLPLGSPDVEPSGDLAVERPRVAADIDAVPAPRTRAAAAMAPPSLRRGPATSLEEQEGDADVI